MRAYELFESNEPIFSGPVFSKRVDLKKAIAAEWGEVNVEFKMVKRSGSRSVSTLVCITSLMGMVTLSACGRRPKLT